MYHISTNNIKNIVLTSNVWTVVYFHSICLSSNIFIIRSMSINTNKHTFTEILANNHQQTRGEYFSSASVEMDFCSVLCAYCLAPVVFTVCIALFCCVVIHSFFLDGLHSGSVDTCFHCASFLFCMLLAPLLLLLPATPTAMQCGGGASPGRGRSQLGRLYRRKQD